MASSSFLLMVYICFLICLVLGLGLDMNSAAAFRIPKFLVIGHRGHGMNILQSSDSRTKAIKENSILSFNSAAKSPIDFIEFDVQVIYSSKNFSFWFIN